MGLKGYSRLKKADLIKFIEEAVESQKQKRESLILSELKNKTNKQLRKIAYELGLKGCSHLKKYDLIKFIEGGVEEKRNEVDLIEFNDEGVESENQGKKFSELEYKTLKQLRKIACEMGVKGYSHMYEDKLIRSIEKAVFYQKTLLDEDFECDAPVSVPEKVWKEFNDECPICLSDDGIFHLMSCKHKIHLGCAKGMYSSNCPICRSEVENFPSYIYKKIKEKNSQFSVSYNHMVMDDRRMFRIFVRVSI